MFEPPNPVPKYYYRCDKIFHLDDLLNLYTVYDTYAIVLISGKRTDLYSHSKNNIKLIKSIECTLPNQHKTGGSSAPRFGRIRDDKINLYVKNVAELMFLKLIKNNEFQHLGLFLAGPGDLKTDIQDNAIFQQHFKKHLLKVITTPEIMDQTINQVTNIISETVYGTNVDAKIIEQFELLLMDKNTIDLLVFGTKYVLEQLKLGALEEIYIYENSMEIIEEYITNTKIKINIVHDDVFVKKYGVMVGVKYYVDVDVDVDANAEANGEY
jgi:peptide chain release factor subunit 1